jgi:hypothetical protein
MSEIINHMICPTCGHDFYCDCAYATCQACGTFFYAAQSATVRKPKDTFYRTNGTAGPYVWKR